VADFQFHFQRKSDSHALSLRLWFSLLLCLPSGLAGSPSIPRRKSHSLTKFQFFLSKTMLRSMSLGTPFALSWGFN